MAWEASLTAEIFRTDRGWGQKPPSELPIKFKKSNLKVYLKSRYHMIRWSIITIRSCYRNISTLTPLGSIQALAIVKKASINCFIRYEIVDISNRAFTRLRHTHRVGFWFRLRKAWPGRCFELTPRTWAVGLGWRLRVGGEIFRLKSTYNCKSMLKISKNCFSYLARNFCRGFRCQTFRHLPALFEIPFCKRLIIHFIRVLVHIEFIISQTDISGVGHKLVLQCFTMKNYKNFQKSWNFS